MIFKWWRKILPVLLVLVFIHFFKDITQDILKISTPLDLFGDVKEDLSSFPAFFQKLFVLLGIGSFIAEIFLLTSIPIVIRRKTVTLLEKIIWVVLFLLFIYFLIAILLDPRFGTG